MMIVKNLANLNEFDIAFLKGNYNICYYLMYEYKNKIKENINENNDNNINNDIYNEPKEKIDEVVVINKSKGKSNTKENKEKLESEYDIHQIYQSYFYNTNFEFKPKINIHYLTCLFFSNVYVIKHLRQNVLRLPQSVKRLRI